MKKILGLDLGVSSIGWALVNEAETPEENSSIIKLGTRVNPLTVDERLNFEKGKSITTNADRTLKRSMRRRLQRFKLRREQLISLLKENHFISEETLLTENGNRTTFETYRLRAKAAKEEITLEELARVLLMINKKRGYKSSRKAKNEDEGALIDGMEIAKRLYEENITPGQLILKILETGKKFTPDFYRSDLQHEFDKIWNFQKQFYVAELSGELKENLRGKNKTQTWAICKTPFNLVGIKRETKGFEQKKENYTWRVQALKEKIGLEELAIVLQDINSQINNSSGYLGAIGDRSKELYFNKQTVGEFLMAELDKNPNFSLRNKVFYRQDYLNEFETIWETQKKYHPELTDDLKHEIRDITIFYQRRLKSQKHLISFCEFENKTIEIEIEGKKKKKLIGAKAAPKSSPLFQEFKIWQILNNLQVIEKYTRKRLDLTQEAKEDLFKELTCKSKMTSKEVLEFLGQKPRDYDLNYTSVEGNRTFAAFFEAFKKIIELSGHDIDFSQKTAEESLQIIKKIFEALNINTEILHFDATLENEQFINQPFYKLYHLLYSYESDSSATGNEKLISKITELFGFEKEYAKILANITFQDDYSSLSTKAIRKILPFLKEGNEYSLACEYAGYRHSKNSLTKEEIENKILKDKLEALPKNSLRNPVVEKILNQMINVVNAAIETYGKPDEIRIELARELKKSAKEREEMTANISKTTREHEEYRKILSKPPFNLTYISRNDLIRYKLYKELEANGFKTFYSNTYIPQEKLFSKEFDIEHIIPQAKLFDDSFSNKTLEVRQVNIEKGNKTALDFVKEKYNNENEYRSRINDLEKAGAISRAKAKKLLMPESEIPSDFINRDLRDSQYIAKKAKEILSDLVKHVVSTSGSITDRLREDWGLMNIMRELNWNKYDKIGMTGYRQDKDGRQIPYIQDWTKRNDHRHHAMDALTIAFTKPSFVQYLHYLNARIPKAVHEIIELQDFDTRDIAKEDRTAVVYAIEKKELYRDDDNHLRFKPPMPLEVFRAEAKKHLEEILISIKAKNKVTTQNINISKKKAGLNKKMQLTPRGQLHLETIYGKSLRAVVKEEKINAKFTLEKIETVTNPLYKKALTERLKAFNNDPKAAFTGKNALDKNPILFTNNNETEHVPLKVKVKTFETIYTIRKEITPDLNVKNVVDEKIRHLLEERLMEFDNNARKAFSNLDENPIWLNKEKGIAIKRVTITGISNAKSLHYKKDHNGKFILENGNKIPVDFVNTGNNHHVAIYKDKNGNLQENVVSFYEATLRKSQGLPIIDKEYKKDEGYEFLFTMKQNEYFVFPNKETGFNPQEVDLMDPKNYAIISPNLFRVQKICSSNYTFRHHLETKIDVNLKELRSITWEEIRTPSNLIGVVKVRMNHLGQIVSVGEY